MATDSLVEFLLDQLSDLPGIRSRRMFGGHGIYLGDAFFAIVHKGEVYFLTDEETRPAYEERGSTPFRPTPRQTLKNYLLVPQDILEDRDQLVEWARLAVACRDR